MAVVVKAHGVFTMGKPVSEATPIAMCPEEASAMTTYRATPRRFVEELPQSEIDRCYSWFRENYGQTGKKPVNSRGWEKRLHPTRTAARKRRCPTLPGFTMAKG